MFIISYLPTIILITVISSMPDPILISFLYELKNILQKLSENCVIVMIYIA